MKEEIVFGDRMMPITLPDDVRTAPPGLATTLSAVSDLEATIRQALQKPLGRPPLREMARPDWKVTIAFDDPSVHVLPRSGSRPSGWFLLSLKKPG
jgi:hypothetical protein